MGIASVSDRVRASGVSSSILRDKGRVDGDIVCHVEGDGLAIVQPSFQVSSVARSKSMFPPGRRRSQVQRSRDLAISIFQSSLSVSTMRSHACISAVVASGWRVQVTDR